MNGFQQITPVEPGLNYSENVETRWDLVIPSKHTLDKPQLRVCPQGIRQSD